MRRGAKASSASSKMQEIIVRVQSPTGTTRISVSSNQTIPKFLQKVEEELSVGHGTWKLYQNRDRSGELKPGSRKTLHSTNIRHGDMLYLVPSSGLDTTDSAGSQDVGSNDVEEDEVDILLSKQDGRIARERDEQLCHHGPKGKCVHCTSLEPYNEEYLQKSEIKHMSFHAHLKKLMGGVDKGKFVALENMSVKIRPGCTEHPPWPGGICTKCQPSAVTLNRQKYRHVDNIMFENHTIVDRFLDYWRKTGNQRLGFLYGKYEHHKDVPLGIRATVAAIYEPPQVGTANSLELLEDRNADVVDDIARKLGLRKVGWIFTDLVADDSGKGTVKNFRNADSVFLSAEECIMAGEFQNQHPNCTKLSPDGTFGSKFVTVVASGDESHQIHFEGYQVSNQCMALVRDDCLVPTKDAPELGYIKESTPEQYVPDVFYKEKDSYGNLVTLLARPLPVEYLLVQVTTGFPVDPVSTFNIRVAKPFPIENRADIGDIQDFGQLTAYMQQFPGYRLLETMSDLHFLSYLATMDMLPLKDHMDPLLEGVREQNAETVEHWSKTDQWATVEQLITAHAPSPPVGGGPSAAGPAFPPGGAAGGVWECKHCTLINQAHNASCEICNLPRT
ncbi:nuclear protein localization protein 4 homolog [Branchiostoma floridae x Branchiostoma japonicum]